MRLIDAYKIDIDRDCYDTYADYIRAFDTINEAPTVDAVPVRYGKWIDGYILDEPIEVCSECNTFYMLKFSGGGMRYCPNCGARMDADDVERKEE